MSQFETRLRATAKRLLDSYGKSMLLRHVDTDAYDTATATPVSVVTTYAVMGSIREPSAIEIDNDLVQAGDRYVTLAAQGLLAPEPVPGDQLEIDGVRWQVLRVNATYSGEDPALYDLHVRS